jgi:uncharacterized membrane protein
MNTENKDNKSISASKQASNKAMGAIKVGWSTFKERPWTSIGLVLLMQVITIAVVAITETSSGEVYMIGAIFNQLLSAFTGMLLLVLFLHMYDKKELGFKKALTSWKMFFNYIVANILMTIAILVGLILLIIPGVIIMFKLMFVPQLVVDRNMGPIEAIKKSWEMTKGQMSYMVSVTLLIIGVLILGMLALVIGLLVAVPVSMYAGIHAYRTVLKANE